MSFSISVSGTANNTLGSTNRLVVDYVSGGVTTHIASADPGATAGISQSLSANQDTISNAHSLAPVAVSGTFSGSVSADHPYAISVMQNGVALAMMQPGGTCSGVAFDISNHLDKLEAKHA